MGGWLPYDTLPTPGEFDPATGGGNTTGHRGVVYSILMCRESMSKVLPFNREIKKS